MSCMLGHAGAGGQSAGAGGRQGKGGQSIQWTRLNNALTPGQDVAGEKGAGGQRLLLYVALGDGSPWARLQGPYPLSLPRLTFRCVVLLKSCRLKLDSHLLWQPLRTAPPHTLSCAQ